MRKVISNNTNTVKLKVKKSKIKINASISALCSKLGVIPVKLIQEIKKIN